MRCRGFTYLGVLFLVTVLSMTAAMAGVVWSTVQRRESERDLVFVGRQFQVAIEQYRGFLKAGPTQYPQQLEDLLRDPRSVEPARHLRRLYSDPMTGEPNWGLVRLADGSIIGVHSLSEREPLQRSALGQGLSFPNAKSYRDWRFIAPSAREMVVVTN